MHAARSPDRRRILDAIFYLARGGIAWRQLPREFPPYPTVYVFFRRWAKAGLWQRIHDALRDLVRLHDGRGSATHRCDHRFGVGAGRGHRLGGHPRLRRGKKVNGRKRHIAMDTSGLLQAVLVTFARRVLHLSVEVVKRTDDLLAEHHEAMVTSP